MVAPGSNPVVIHAWVDAMTGINTTVQPGFISMEAPWDYGLKARVKGGRESLVDCEILSHANESEHRARRRPQNVCHRPAARVYCRATAMQPGRSPRGP